MEPEGKHRNSIMKQRILALFGLVEIVLRCTLTMNDFQGLMMQLEGSDNGAGSLEAPSSDPESQSWFKSISGQFQQAQICAWGQRAPPVHGGPARRKQVQTRAPRIRTVHCHRRRRRRRVSTRSRSVVSQDRIPPRRTRSCARSSGELSRTRPDHVIRPIGRHSVATTAIAPPAFTPPANSYTIKVKVIQFSLISIHRSYHHCRTVTTGPRHTCERSCSPLSPGPDPASALTPYGDLTLQP
ncbi:hypothetical protein EVAR_46959_1 [Eumeta japonica]|uniref:Uncharacterized protein n=1 Tax=Eumeta variegata TaxID=151549 RepID=A0A4C1YI84_EUMVA|nr:hypothetical protein EVAR_46959_1 [Eumeta japonica]